MTFTEALPKLLQHLQIRSNTAGGNTILLFCGQLHATHPTYSHLVSYALRRADIEATDWGVVE